MNITDEIQKESGGDFVKQQEPTDARYSMFNTGGVELEVGEFLYGLVRMMKPDNVLETGTHLGVGASYIGSALKDNDHGHLTTIEFNSDIHDRAEFTIGIEGLTTYVTCLWKDVTVFETKEMYDILFLDTEPNLRFNELLKFWDNLKPGGIVIIHDLHIGMSQDVPTVNGMENWPFGTLPDKIKELIKSKELQCLHFSTPRGLFMAQKRREDFYSNKL